MPVSSIAQLRAMNKRKVARMITNYKKLSPKIEKLCRVMEAKQLIKMARNWGNDTQKNAIVSLFVTNSRLGVWLQCHCVNPNCAFIEFDRDNEENVCHCIREGSLNCRGIYPIAFDSDGEPIGVDAE